MKREKRKGVRVGGEGGAYSRPEVARLIRGGTGGGGHGGWRNMASLARSGLKMGQI